MIYCGHDLLTSYDPGSRTDSWPYIIYGPGIFNGVQRTVFTELF